MFSLTARRDSSSRIAEAALGFRMEDTPFGKNLQEAMVRAKIKPSTLARELRVSRATIYKWLSGQLPSRKHARFLQSRLGLTDSDVSKCHGCAPKHHGSPRSAYGDHASDRAISRLCN